ncbi:MAG: hypothetical protein ABFR75_01125 [Acidobacteriota bacterium]
MKKALIILITLALFLFVSNCKTSDTEVDLFQILTVTGYSLSDSADSGLTSINLFFSIKNKSDNPGTITSWNFKLKHNIVTLLEINNNNYNDFNLEFSGNTTVPEGEVIEFFVNTPLPFIENALGKDKLSFDPYTPSEVVVELQITDNEGKTHMISKRGSYTFEYGKINSDKYNILGNWEFNRTINGNAKAKQKITFVGTKTSGNFVIYNFSTGRAEGSGSFSISGVKNIRFNSSEGTSYWGEFLNEANLTGTLLKGNDTGTWNAKKL